MAMKDSSIKCKIDPSDMDNYGHLNNAAFPKYFEKGREDLAIKNGLDRNTLIAKDLAFLVKKTSYDYIVPVLEDQEVEVRSRVDSVRGARVLVEQEMFYEAKIVSKCTAEYFFMDLKTKKPMRPLSSVFH